MVSCFKISWGFVIFANQPFNTTHATHTKNRVRVIMIKLVPMSATDPSWESKHVPRCKLKWNGVIHGLREFVVKLSNRSNVISPWLIAQSNSRFPSWKRQLIPMIFQNLVLLNHSRKTCVWVSLFKICSHYMPRSQTHVRNQTSSPQLPWSKIIWIDPISDRD